MPDQQLWMLLCVRGLDFPLKARLERRSTISTALKRTHLEVLLESNPICWNAL